MATKGNSEEARGHAILEAKGHILGFLCTDNILRDKDFLRTMTWYAAQMDVVGAYTAQYDHVTYDKPLSRYFALLGANDPVCWWLGKADRKSYLHNGLETSIYQVGNRMSSIGDNGFFCKRFAMRQAVNKPEDHFVIDVVKKMWNLGYTRYYRVATQKLWHKSGESWLTYFKKRYRYADELYFRDYHKRSWLMVETMWDWIMVALFAIFSLLIIPNLITATLGYRKVHDPAWFLHPIICFGLTLVYSWLLIKHLSLSALLTVRKLFKRA